MIFYWHNRKIFTVAGRAIVEDISLSAATLAATETNDVIRLGLPPAS